MVRLLRSAAFVVLTTGLAALCGGCGGAPCTSSCDGRECGADGCGGSCGSCGANAACDEAGLCSCDFSSCGATCCREGDVCSESGCCAPSCAGRECGSDGCGGSCGSCGADAACDAAGLCQCAFEACGATCCPEGDLCWESSCCTPDCSGRECGTDGCGGSCGSCVDGQACLPEGVCATWWRGNLHTHSDLSDGDSDAEAVALWYQELLYDFLVLTDHHTWSDFARFSTDDFVAIDGEEVSSAGHVNALNISATIPTTPRTLQQLVDAVLAAGGVPVLNHPAWTSLPLSMTDLWPVTGASLMEVHNHITDLGFDEVLWDGLLTSGKPIFGVASDDCHHLASEAGHGWVMVLATTPTTDEILGALVRGDFYASTGPTVTDVVAAPGSLTVQSVDGLYIEFIGAGGRVLSTVTGSTGSHAFDGSERYVRARVTSPAGKAWTQPVFSGDFSRDPYADVVVAAAGIDPATLTPLLGPPYLGRVPGTWEQHGSRISAGQHVDLDMGEGEEVLDEEGLDLYVEEVDAEDTVGGADAYEVLVSSDGIDWVSLGTGIGDSSFDLAAGGVSSARYVRISVAVADAEIDAVMYLDPILRDPDADVVVEVANRTDGLAPNALGPPFPGAVPSPWTLYGVGIAAGGRLVLDMGAGEEVLDWDGPDLAVEEVGADEGGADDPYRVSASEDGVTWALLGEGTGDASFDLEAGGLAWARYVRLEVLSGNAEFDAVTAL